MLGSMINFHIYFHLRYSEDTCDLRQTYGSLRRRDRQVYLAVSIETPLNYLKPDLFVQGKLEGLADGSPIRRQRIAENNAEIGRGLR